ncbi:MAG: nucleotide exchange factor GrpE [Chloroflexi bacterium]|nr:nucleotide exchange factor GrpE [Chloroflexota bacterium]
MNGYFDPLGRPTRPPTIGEFNQLLRAYRKLKEQNEKLVALIKEYEKELPKMRAEVDQAKAETDKLRSQLRQTNADLAEARREMTEWRRQLEEYKRELEQYKTQLREAAPPENETDWREGYLRLRADMENYRRRQAQRFEQVAQEHQQRILLDMLPLADHLEMGLQHLQEDEADDAATLLNNYQANIQATLQAFLDALKRYGVEPIAAQGEPFDPEFHEAVGQISSDDIPEGHVAQVLQTGYTMNGRLLRPARVLVSRGKE